MLPTEPLRIPAFRNLWLGQLISQVGDSLYFVVFMFMVKKITGSDVMVGLVGAAETLPYVLFGPTSGVLADKFDRRKIMLWSDVASGSFLLAVGALVLVVPQPPAALFVVTAFILSTLRAVFLPAKSAAVPAVVPSDMLLRANSLSTATQNMVPIMGLGLSAGVLSILYRQSPQTFFATTIALNALTFYGSGWYIAKLPPIRPDRERLVKVSGWHDFAEGLRYIRTRRELVVLMLLGLLMNLMISPFFVIYLAANERWFGGKPETVAILELTFFLGMLVSSIAVGALNVRRVGAGYIVGLTVTGLTVTGLTVAAMAFGNVTWLWFAGFAPWLGGTSWFLAALGAAMTIGFWQVAVMNMLAGLAVPFAQIPTNTFVQATTPDAYRGRVNSVLVTMSVGVMPIGYGLGGFLLQKVGVERMFLVMGLGMMAVALAGLLDRSFRTSLLPQEEVAASSSDKVATEVPEHRTLVEVTSSK